jgi:ABC-2 type transport system ATP-binding protein
VRLADALARTGVLEIDTLSEGWLGVAGTNPVHIGDVALDAAVAIYGMVHERIELEQLFFQLTAAPWRAG